MAIDVEAARIPDRDRLVQLLGEHGLEAEPHGRARDRGAGRRRRRRVFHEVESLIMQIGAPFVPIKHEGVIYIRPPVG